MLFGDELTGGATAMRRVRWDGVLPDITTGSPRQKSWAADIRNRYVRDRWGDRWPFKMSEMDWSRLTQLVEAKWWIDNRNDVERAFDKQEPWPEVDQAKQYWPPDLTARTSEDRRRAMDIRRALTEKRWGSKIPPAVQEVLNRLVDADWWLRNEVGDGYPQAIDRAVGDELPEYDRRMMALPNYGPYVPPHPGPCTGRPDYAVMHAAAKKVVAEHGDLRLVSLPVDIPVEARSSCCGAAGRNAGEAEGKEIWISRRAAEIRRRSPRGVDAEKEARSNMWRMERNLDGHG
ncbi:hypothetical protein [Amycolatopsis sp. NPDC051071]|uniref:hypothetical protein n=1 Tax=Amycolatopsis sp. NPDC051071 TaxID=3154637 RepID=UPI0034464D1C